MEVNARIANATKCVCSLKKELSGIKLVRGTNKKKGKRAAVARVHDTKISKWRKENRAQLGVEGNC